MHRNPTTITLDKKYSQGFLTQKTKLKVVQNIMHRNPATIILNQNHSLDSFESENQAKSSAE